MGAHNSCPLKRNVVRFAMCLASQLPGFIKTIVVLYVVFIIHYVDDAPAPAC